MSMTEQEFDALVARLEDEAGQNPGFYKLRLGAFASLGYLYLIGVVVLLVAVTVGLILSLFLSRGLILLIKKLVIPLVILIGVVLRSLWVRLDAPEGRRLERRDHPVLFALIDDLRRTAKAPRAHVVLLTNDFNAAIVQVPRLGMFGWQKNYLILGLPLMQLLTLEEFKAVVAHEFGHLSGAHGRFGAWIYRIRAGWARLDETLQKEQHWGSFMFVPFFRWFAPKFAAYSFVQARQQEYEADRVAAATVGAGSLASALVRLRLKARELEESYWPAIYSRADHEPEPTVAPFSGLLAAERRGFLPQVTEHLAMALERQTSTADTHPCLRDRLAALRCDACVPGPLERSAADLLLGDGLDALASDCDREWRRTVSDWWIQRHSHVENGRRELEQLEGRAPNDLADHELYRYAQLTEEHVGADQAFPLYAELVARESGHVGGRFDHARLLLSRGDASGIAIIEELMQQTPTAILPGCDVIVGFLRGQGRDDETQPYIERYWRQQQAEEEAHRERQSFRLDDKWLSPELSEESLTLLVRLLAESGEVKAAYLVRKDLPGGQPPMHLLGVVRKSGLFERGAAAANQALIQSLANKAAVREDLRLVPLSREFRRYEKLFAKVPGSKIYDATTPSARS